MKKTVALAVSIVGVLLGLAGEVMAQDVIMDVRFEPEVWVTPGSPVRMVVEVKNTGVTDLTDATVVVDFGSPYFVNPTIETQGELICTMSSTLAHISMSARCTGGVVKAGESVLLTFDDFAPESVLYSYGVNMGATAHLLQHGVTDSASLLVVDDYNPDLRVTAELSSSTSVVGQLINYVVTVVNGGPVGTRETSLVATLPDGRVETRVVPALGVGAGQEVVLMFSYLPNIAGVATLKFEVDPEQLVAEKTEVNNTTVVTVDVRELVPDLVISQEQVASVAMGGTFIRYVTVRNAGNVRAEGISVRDSFYYIAIDRLESQGGFVCKPTYVKVGRSSRKQLYGYECSGGVLNPGESALIAVVLRPSYLLRVGNTLSVDPANSIRELNELNNKTSGVIQVI